MIFFCLRNTLLICKKKIVMLKKFCSTFFKNLKLILILIFVFFSNQTKKTIIKQLCWFFFQCNHRWSFGPDSEKNFISIFGFFYIIHCIFCVLYVYFRRCFDIDIWFFKQNLTFPNIHFFTVLVSFFNKTFAYFFIVIHFFCWFFRHNR